MPGWERQDDATDRFSAAVEGLAGQDAVVVTHGTVLSLWLQQHVSSLDAIEFWDGLAMPDAYVVEFDPPRLTRMRRP